MSYGEASPTSAPAFLSNLLTACKKISFPLPSTSSSPHEQELDLEEFEKEEDYHQDTYEQFYFVKRILLPAFKDRSVAIAMFCSSAGPGDTGAAFASFLLQGLSMEGLRMKVPLSWKYVLEEPLISDHVERMMIY